MKEKLKAVQPFLVYKFYGSANVLCDDDGTPMSVECVPPSMSFIIESAQITTMILRYSKDYQKKVASVQTGDGATLENKTKLASEILQEVSDNINKTTEDQVEMVAIMSRLGREYLVQKAIRVWWGDTKEAKEAAVKVLFTTNKEAAEEANDEADESTIAIWVDLVTEMETLNVGMELMKAIPEGDIPNIPLESTAITPEGKVEKGVTASVPADRLAKFPRNTRSLVVEDVRPDDGPGDRNSRGHLKTRSKLPSVQRVGDAGSED